MRKLLKVLNPFIWLWNCFKYSAHLHHWAEMEGFAQKRGEHCHYERYDFSTDTKYF